MKENRKYWKMLTWVRCDVASLVKIGNLPNQWARKTRDSAPCALNNSFATSMWPFAHAIHKGVLPSLLVWCTSAGTHGFAHCHWDYTIPKAAWSFHQTPKIRSGSFFFGSVAGNLLGNVHLGWVWFFRFFLVWPGPQHVTIFLGFQKNNSLQIDEDRGPHMILGWDFLIFGSKQHQNVRTFVIFEGIFLFLQLVLARKGPWNFGGVELWMFRSAVVGARGCAVAPPWGGKYPPPRLGATVN